MLPRVTYYIDGLDLQLLLISDGFLLADLICFNAHHVDQFICILVLLLQLCLLDRQCGFQFIHLHMEGMGEVGHHQTLMGPVSSLSGGCIATCDTATHVAHCPN